MTAPTWEELMNKQVTTGNSVPTWEELMAKESVTTAPPVPTQVADTPPTPTWEELMADEPPKETSFAKGFVEGESLTQQAADILGAATGFASEVHWAGDDFYKSAEDLYGEDWDEIGFDERRKRMTALREQRIKEQYGDVEGSTFGNIVGSLTDPTTALPVGQTYKAMSAIGTALGGTYSAANQLLHKGEIDPLETGIHAVAGGVLAPIGGYVFNKAGYAIGNKITAKRVTSANKALDDLEANMAHVVASGGDPKTALNTAADRLGLIAEDIEIAKKLTQREPRMLPPKHLEEAQSKGKGISSFVESVSSRVKEISPKIHHVLRDYENKLMKDTAQRHEVVRPFLNKLNAYTKAEQTAINNHLINQNLDGAKKLLTKGGQAELIKVMNLTKKDGAVYEQMFKSSGFKSIKNYFPRMVKDLEGLRKELGRIDPTAQGKLSTTLEKLANEQGVKVHQLAAQDVESAVRQAVAKPKKEVLLTGSRAHRTVEEVEERLMKYYASPQEALAGYIDQSTRSMGKFNLFGSSNARNNVAVKRKGEKLRPSYTSSALYKVIGSETQRGRISKVQEQELVDLLNVRFDKGEQQMSNWLGTIRDVGYMSALGQFRSAATQLKDIGTSAYLHGVLPTAQSLFGGNKYLKDSGIAATVSAEMTKGGTRKLLDTTMSVSGFRFVDRLGKGTLLKASMIKAKKLASTPEGIIKLKRKYGEAYGEEFTDLVAALRQGKDNKLTEMYRFHELSDTQPVSLLELPEKYLNHPDGRIFFSLKSFALKQLTLLHNDVIKKAKAGHNKEAALNLLRYSALVGISGGTVDEAKGVLSGEQFNVADIPENALDNLLAVFLMSKFNIDQVSQGKWGEAGAGIVMPSVAPLTGAIKSVKEAVDPDRDTNKELLTENEFIKSWPIFGRVLYDWVLGGKEKAYNKDFVEAGKL